MSPKRLTSVSVKKLLLILLITSLSTFVSSAQKEATDVFIVELDHGMYTTKAGGKEKVLTTLTESITWVTDHQLLLKTDTIFCEIGKAFGVDYMPRTKDGKSYYINLTVVWEFPKPMKNPFNGKTYENSYHTQSFITNQPSFNCYQIDYDYEIVEGWWTLKILNGEKTIYTKKFWIVSPI